MTKTNESAAYSPRPLECRVRALPEPRITTALVLDEVGRQIPMQLVGAYYTADQMRAAIDEEREACAKLCEAQGYRWES